MLLVKLGIFAMLGKNFYFSFIFAHLIHQASQSIKKKITHMEVVVK